MSHKSKIDLTHTEVGMVFELPRTGALFEVIDVDELYEEIVLKLLNKQKPEILLCLGKKNEEKETK